MARFAANLSMMFTELPFLERFGAAAAAGFTGVEFLFPYEFSPTQISEQLQAHGLTQALFNAPPGDWAAGERGTAAIPGREAEFRRGIALALEYAAALRCEKVHVMAGNISHGVPAKQTYDENLAHAADEAAKAGQTITIEPINPRDMPQYFLNDVDFAHQTLRRVGRPNLKLQFDVYHAQIIHGDVTRLMQRYIADIAHVQIASVPERNEPDSGEINYPYVLRELQRAGYAGWVGCEYNPLGDTDAGLGWLAQYRTGIARDEQRR